MATKQVIIIRRDLGMRRGKEIAQGCHVSLGVFLSKRLTPSCESNARVEGRVLMVPLWEAALEWLCSGCRKIVLQVGTEKELLELWEKAKAAGLPEFLVVDAGLTEFSGRHTFTALAIGPERDELIDELTGSLKLY